MTAHTVIPTEHVKRPGKPVAIYTPVKRLPKRGDLAVHVQSHHDYIIGQGAQDRLSVRLGIVTSVARDGQILRAWFPFSGTSTEPDAERAEHAARMSGGALHYVAAEKVDVPAVLAEYVQRRYPSAPHSEMIQPFSENSEARALIVAHKTAGASHA